MPPTRYLSRAKLDHVDLSYAELQHANLRGADLRSAAPPAANLRGANLSQADLSDAMFADGEECANLSSSIMTGVTVTATRVLRLEYCTGIESATFDPGFMPSYVAKTFEAVNREFESSSDPGDFRLGEPVGGWLTRLESLRQLV